MSLLFFILMAIPISILAIVLWMFYDYRKYKKQNNLIILLLLLFPTTLSAQYVNENCQVSFRWYENQKGKLECSKDGIKYQFIPSSTSWRIVIKNTSPENTRINWINAQLIINGKATEINNNSLNLEGSIIKSDSEVGWTMTASPSQEYKISTKIYDEKYLKKGNKVTVTLILPIAIGNQPQFSNTFDFIITQVN